MRANLLQRFLADEHGATAIEYALIGTLVSLAILAGVTLLAEDVKNLFSAGGAGQVLGTRAESL